MYVLINVSFSYKDDKVLNTIDLSIKEGDVIGILGHNGAGKTTLFKLLTGLVQPDSGEIEILNKNKKVAYLPHDNGVHEKLTVMENCIVRATIMGVSKDVIDDVLNKLSLINKSNHIVSKLSNGQKKRVALALVLISLPDIIILDEVTNGIDPASLEAIVNILLKLKDEGKTIIFASHNLPFVKRIANRVVMLKETKIIADTQLNDDFNLEQFYMENSKGEFINGCI